MDPWEDDSGQGGQKQLGYLLGLYINNVKSDSSGIKSKCKLHIMKPQVEKKNCKNLEN